MKKENGMFARNSVTAKQAMENQITFFFINSIDKNDNGPIIVFNN